jgi:hypothetical protein
MMMMVSRDCSSAIKMDTSFRLCRWEDPPSEVRLAVGSLRGEVSIASCLGYSVRACQ